MRFITHCLDGSTEAQDEPFLLGTDARAAGLGLLRADRQARQFHVPPLAVTVTVQDAPQPPEIAHRSPRRTRFDCSAMYSRKAWASFSKPSLLRSTASTILARRSIASSRCRRTSSSDAMWLRHRAMTAKPRATVSPRGPSSSGGGKRAHARREKRTALLRSDTSHSPLCDVHCQQLGAVRLALGEAVLVLMGRSHARSSCDGLRWEAVVFRQRVIANAVRDAVPFPRDFFALAWTDEESVVARMRREDGFEYRTFRMAGIDEEMVATIVEWVMQSDPGLPDSDGWPPSRSRTRPSRNR